MGLSSSVDANLNYFCGFEMFSGVPRLPAQPSFPLGGRRGGEVAGDRVVVAAGPAGASCPASPDRLLWPGWERLRPHSGVQGGCACGGGEPREAVLMISGRTARRACSGLPGARVFLLEGESRQHGPALLSLGTRRAPHPRPAPPYLRQRIEVGFDGLPRSLSLLAMAMVVPPDRTPALPPHAAPCRGNGERSRAEAGARQGRRAAGAPGALEVCRALEPRADRAAEGPLLSLPLPLRELPVSL